MFGQDPVITRARLSRCLLVMLLLVGMGGWLPDPCARHSAAGAPSAVGAVRPSGFDSHQAPRGLPASTADACHQVVVKTVVAGGPVSTAVAPPAAASGRLVAETAARRPVPRAVPARIGLTEIGVSRT